MVALGFAALHPTYFWETVKTYIWVYSDSQSINNSRLGATQPPVNLTGGENHGGVGFRCATPNLLLGNCEDIYMGLFR
ncbi:hypothetical protein N39L_21640 [Limnospira platensis NIES-39]|nr:hypothetical protein AP285_09890 [Arthrospira platensis YZ]KDR55655.1 hypothetical protein APPUASWS_020840 [Arthrospira platensis str. Paraca]BDT12439.1 hypothetical protein N39L_21620 [Arthrospira platensis NIES-39]BDT12441.1 hypothetical protein N39L_21640 [Arthrospira platensis NIES-39]